MNKIRKGDQVIVLTGRDKGKRGAVLERVDEERILVEGVNVVKKHVKPNPMKGTTGGVVDKTLSIHQSNVAIFNAATGKADRVGIKLLSDAERQSRKTRENGVRVRPHAKTHKSAAIALRQIANGAVGQCVQKVGEAEALVRGGVTDILVSNQVVGDRKLRRLASLAKDATIALCFDSAEQVDAASRIAADFGVELGGLVEIEVGMER